MTRKPVLLAVSPTGSQSTNGKGASHRESGRHRRVAQASYVERSASNPVPVKIGLRKRPCRDVNRSFIR